jgi:fused-like protein
MIMVITIIIMVTGDYTPLANLMGHPSSVVKSRVCSLLGNLMKHDAQMYPVLQQREKIVQALVACLHDEDSNVRKVRLEIKTKKLLF